MEIFFLIPGARQLYDTRSGFGSWTAEAACPALAGCSFAVPSLVAYLGRESYVRLASSVRGGICGHLDHLTTK